MLGKIEGRRRKDDRMRWLDGITDLVEFEQALGDGERQGSLACCSPWGRKESDTTERQNNNMLWVQRRLVEIDIDQEKTKSEWKSLSCDPLFVFPWTGILQARILEWVAFPFSRDLPNPGIKPRDQIQVSCIAGRFFTTWAVREALVSHKSQYLFWGAEVK